MGIVVPRPAIRKREARTIEARLARLDELIASGMDADTAYEQALKEIK